MQRLNRPTVFVAVLALVAASALALTGAFAGEAPATPEAPATKTPSPIHSLMGWMSSSVVGDLESPCPSCPKAEKAWRSWFDGGSDVKLAGLRDRLVADGWTADRYIGYFQDMAKASKGSCGEKCGDKSDCANCPSKGDCDKGDCTDCPSKGECHKGGCGGGGCGGCPKGEKQAEPEPDATAAK